MFKKVLILAMCLTAGAFSVSCSPASPKLVAQPEVVFDKIDIKGDSGEYKPEVDILFVVDRSASMDSIQKNLSNNIDLFLNGLVSTKVNYHIGVIASDGETYNGLKEPGCSFFCTTLPNTFGILQGDVKFVTPTTANGLNILKKNILVGVQGDGDEQFFEPISQALSPELSGPGKANYGFIRDSAYFAVVFITDTDDHSKAANYDSTYKFLVNFKKSRNKVLSYGILIPSALGSALPAGCVRDSSDNLLPGSLEAFLHQTINNKSNEMNLCDPQFGTQLTKFSKDLVRYLVGTIPLNKVPVISSIQVFFGGKELPSDLSTGWYYDPRINAVIMGNNIVLDDEGDGSGLRIKFDAVSVN